MATAFQQQIPEQRSLIEGLSPNGNFFGLHSATITFREQGLRGTTRVLSQDSQDGLSPGYMSRIYQTYGQDSVNTVFVSLVQALQENTNRIYLGVYQDVDIHNTADRGLQADADNFEFIERVRQSIRMQHTLAPESVATQGQIQQIIAAKLRNSLYTHAAQTKRVQQENLQSQRQGLQKMFAEHNTMMGRGIKALYRHAADIPTEDTQPPAYQTQELAVQNLAAFITDTLAMEERLGGTTNRRHALRFSAECTLPKTPAEETYTAEQLRLPRDGEIHINDGIHPDIVVSRHGEAFTEAQLRQIHTLYGAGGIDKVLAAVAEMTYIQAERKLLGKSTWYDHEMSRTGKGSTFIRLIEHIRDISQGNKVSADMIHEGLVTILSERLFALSGDKEKPLQTMRRDVENFLDLTLEANTMLPFFQHAFALGEAYQTGRAQQLNVRLRTQAGTLS